MLLCHALGSQATSPLLPALHPTQPALAAPPCTLQVAGVAGSSATYATLCDVFAKQGKWDKLRTAVQVKGGRLPGPGRCSMQTAAQCHTGSSPCRPRPLPACQPCQTGCWVAVSCLALPPPPLPGPAEWMEAQGEDPAQITYAQLMERASEGGNWQRALDLFDGAPGCLERTAPPACQPGGQSVGFFPSDLPAFSLLPRSTHLILAGLPAGMESSLTIGGSQPNSVTYSAAIIACARLSDWQRAVELKDQMLARCAACAC